jgi:hypothetical protein
MALELSLQNERFVAQALALGLFPSRESLLDQAVDTLRAAMRDSFGEDSAGDDSGQVPFDDTSGGPLPRGFDVAAAGFDGESLGGRAWDSDAVMRRIFESLAEAGVRTND